MRSYDAKVSEGHIVIDEFVDLPEGTRLQVVVLDAMDDDLDDDARAARESFLTRSWQSEQEGRSRSADALVGHGPPFAP